MMQAPNSVKILFIGQDGTHIAEAANRPATAGFGGRAQDLAKYFGVTSSAAFINTYAFTIRGQYGSHDSPIIHKDTDGNVTNVDFESFVDNQLWLISQDQNSPIVKWRSELIDWIIRNNSTSLQMIVTFGGAARDSIGSFVINHGGKVGSDFSADDLSSIMVPEAAMVPAGGNNEEPVPMTKAGSDAYALFTGIQTNYADPNAVSMTEQAFAAKLQSNPALLQQLVFSKGLNGSGVIDPAQIGGYDIDRKMQASGTGPANISLRGMKLSDGSVIERDLLVVQLPHPTFLTMMYQNEGPEAVAAAVAKKVAGMTAYLASPQACQGNDDCPKWGIQPDAGQTNQFPGKYNYGRSDMGPEYYDFGAPASRMVNVSDASRASTNVIVFGTRDKVNFDQNAINAMTKAKPSQFPPASELWIARARGPETRNMYDPGPPATMAKTMKENLPFSLVNSPAHAVNHDFGHYRGTFANPSVVILADPDGFDDLSSGRALTGARGQYLNGLMQDLGVGDNYLVIKTAPFSHCDDQDWSDVMNQTQAYRDAVFSAILAEGTPKVIIADGNSAGQELQRMQPNLQNIPLVKINRVGSANNSGIVDASAAIAQALGSSGKATGKMIDLPRTHLVFYERWWGGKGGDHVISTSPSDPKYCQVFALVAPQWATSQHFQMEPSDQSGVSSLLQKESDLGILLPSQKKANFAN
jgi:hypothetical protein